MDRMQDAIQQSTTPFLWKIRRLLLDTHPNSPAVLYCSIATQKELLREMDMKSMTIVLDFEGGDFTYGDLNVDGATISVLTGTPDGEFIFFPG